LLSAAVAPDGSVRAVESRPPGRAEPGSPIAKHPAMLALLAAVFLAATLAVPLRSLRNADALALAAFAVPVWLFNESYVRGAVFAGAALMAWLVVRCAWTAMGPAPPPARPLIEELASRLSPGERRRLGAAAGVALVLGVVVVTVTSTGVSDVALASMAGATHILDGTSPYVHLPSEVLHGDTYPLLAYVAYVPGALLMPVHDSFDDLTGALLVTAAAALAASAAMSRRPGRPLAAVGWLAFPPLLVTASAGRNDVVAGALAAWVLASPAAAARSSGLLASAAWVKLAPAAALPVWLARFRGHDLARAAAAVVLLSAGCVVLLAALGGSAAIDQMLDGMSFQLTRGSSSSVWSQLGTTAGQHVFQALVIAAAAGAVLAVRRDARLAADPRRAAAACAALLLGVQLSASYWTYAYVVFAFPFIAAALLPLPPRSPRREQRAP
jgi:hypothetical protein